MKKSALVLATLAVVLSMTGTSIAAPWAVPGGACTQEGANANSNGFLTCTGGVWVSNAVLMGTTAATCDSTNAGYIRYNSGQFEGCNGTGWIQLVGGGRLKVYQADGVTELGNLIGTTALTTDPGKCVGLMYSDLSTGQIQKTLSSLDCDTPISTQNIYFSAANCTGTTWVNSGGSNFHLQTFYCCTGSATCTTNLCVPDLDAGAQGTKPYLSDRSSAGVCTNHSGNIGTYLSRPRRCGETGGACVVK